jgi:DNA-binding MarR family transcriptional regulator
MLIICAIMNDQIGLAFGEIARLLRRRFDARARAMGATRAQWMALKMISRGEGINQGRLAEQLEVEPITASRMIDRLEEAGMVERRRDPGDRRAWLLFLTDKSRPVIDDLRVVANEVFEQALDGLSAGQRADLLAMFDTIRTNLGTEPQEATNG